MRYVIKFTKESEIKFISHLDMMRTIQRVIRRAELPIEYSKGFNPHMALSLAQPLSVGVYSAGEYMDIVLTEELEEDVVIEKLNAKTASGIKFLEAKKVINIENEKKTPQTMALVDAAKFTMKIICKDTEKVEEKVRDLLKENQWVTMKKSKKGEKEVDIKPLVKELKFWVKDDNLILNVLLSSGSREHLSPDLLAKYIGNKIDNIDKDMFVDIKREEMYVLKGSKYIPLYKSV